MSIAKIIGQFFYKKATFKNVNTYCFFIGYPRSGHSLYGALLDAHPNCIVSHELNVLNLLKSGKSKVEIFNAILKNSRGHYSAGRKNEGYTYDVKNQWQGKFNKIKVLGDKQGGKTSRMLSVEPGLLQDLSDELNIQIKILHVYRNPFDNLASRAKGGRLEKKKFSKALLIKDIEKHFIQANVNDKIRKDGLFEVLDIQHENFISSPMGGLKRICDFLGLQPSEDYLKDCTSIVFQKPHRTRFDIDFPDDLIQSVNDQIKNYDFLSGYSFDDT